MESFKIWNFGPQRYSVTLRVPAEAVQTYLTIFLYSTLFLRGVEPAGGYVCDGSPSLVAKDEKMKSYIRCMIAEVIEWVKQGRLDHLALYIYNKESYAYREFWQLYINATHEDTDHPWNGDELKCDILDINRFLPILDRPLDFYVDVFYDVMSKKQFLHP